MPDVAAHDVFTSYSHEDESLREELDNHLALLKRKGIVRAWYDRDITAGEPWRDRIDEHLESADLILLLVSANFFASDYCYDVEMKRALERRDAGQAKVIPIIARSVDLEDVPFKGMQWLPSGGRPVTSWPNRDEAWTDVVKGIRRSIDELESSPAWAARRGALRTSVGPAGWDGRAAEPMELRAEVAAGGAVPGPAPATPPPAPPPEPRRAAPATAQPPEPEGALWTNRFGAVLGAFEKDVEEANARRGIVGHARDEIHRLGDDLASIVEMKRILWVDDAPENNVTEIAALARLQIEVRTSPSTEQALEVMARDPEPYHLVISDWSRPAEGRWLPAGLRLLAAMRKRRIHTPLVFYYGVLSKPLEAVRHAMAIAAGAEAATFLPGDLLKAIRQVLA